MISYVDSTRTDQTEDITLPTPIDANDFLIVQAAYDVIATPPATPSGWTLLGTQAAEFNDANQAVFYRVADGTEDGSTVTFEEGSPGVGKVERVCLQYRGVSTSSPIENWASDWGSGGSPPVDGPAVTASPGSLIVALLCVWSGSYTPTPLVVTFSDTAEALSLREESSSTSTSGLWAADAFRFTASGGWTVGSVRWGGSSSGGIAAGTGTINYTPDPTGRRTFFTLALRAA